MQFQSLKEKLINVWKKFNDETGGRCEQGWAPLSLLVTYAFHQHVTEELSLDDGHCIHHDSLWVDNEIRIFLACIITWKPLLHHRSKNYDLMGLSEYLSLPMFEFISLVYPTPLFLDAFLWIYLQKISFFQKQYKKNIFQRIPIMRNSIIIDQTDLHFKLA